MSARGYQEIREEDVRDDQPALIKKINAAIRSLNDSIDGMTQEYAIATQSFTLTVGGAVTTFNPTRVSFPIKPTAVVIGSVSIYPQSVTTCEGVNGIDWDPLSDNAIQIRAINGLTINTTYKMTLVAYG